MLADSSTLEFRQKRLDDLQHLLPASRVEKFAYAEKLTDRKKEAEERFRDTLFVWLSFWRDVLVSASGSSAPLVNVDRLAEIEALAARLEKNVNARLLAEVTLLDWPHG
jgi:hypothetical protein